jgi:hypothetical protein
MHRALFFLIYRLQIYVKLFLLMGGTWLLEVLSWIIGGQEWIWYIPDSFNCSRGVFVFYFCVWSNKKVRESLLSRVRSKDARKFTSDDESKSVSQNKTTSKIINSV